MLLATTSCMDFQPISSLGDEYVWTSEANFQLFANQFYAWDRGFSSLISGTYMEPRADLITGYATQNDYSQGVYTVSSTDSSYGTYYTRIYYCNLLLENAASYSDQESISTPMGEAYFYRGNMYFELLRLWGGVPLITKTLDIDSPELYYAQATRGEIIDQIISDYQTAIEYLPETASETGRLTKNIALSNLARIALYEGTWQKFHSHCAGGKEDGNGNFSYDSFGRYDEADVIANTERSSYLLAIALDAAEQVMDSGAYQLFRNETLGDDSYRAMFNLEDAAQCNIANVGKSANTEYIHVDRNRDGDTMTAVTHSLMYNSWVVTRKMADMYLCTDGLDISVSSLFQGRADYQDEFVNRDPRMESCLLVYTDQYWLCDGRFRVYWDDTDYENMHDADKVGYTGYWNAKWGTQRECIDSYETMDFPIMRYAEILLIYAEATFELNNAITDEELNRSINLIRERVSMPYLNNQTTTYSGNNTSMRREIRRERSVELYCEGFRLDDIKRWAKGSDEMPGDLEGVLHTGTRYESQWQFSDSELGASSDGYVIFRSSRVWDDSKHYLYPFPTTTLQLNESLMQNAGWE